MSFIENLLMRSGQGRSSYAPFWPEDSSARPLKPIKISTSMLASTRWDLCLIALRDFGEIAKDVSTLSQNSLETNIFFEPEFLAAGIHRVDDNGVMLLCLWEGVTPDRQLRCFMPVVVKKSGLPRHRYLSVFTHDFAPLGTPLLHRNNSAETAEHLLRMLGDPDLDFPQVLALDQQRLEGETIAVFLQAADRLGLEHKFALGRKRAELKWSCPEKFNPDQYLKKSLGKKRLKEYARLLRRLGEQGKVSFNIARTPIKTLDAIEDFLTLEARGWKGRGGTALYSLKQIAAFSRQAISALAEVGHCEIHTLKLDNRVIAGLVAFQTKGEFFTWKIAFDEDFAAYSPGVQIMLNASQEWLGHAKFQKADSLAIPNHKMIDHLWRERQEIGTLVLEIGRPQTGYIARVAAAFERQHRAKEWLKSQLARTIGYR